MRLRFWLHRPSHYKTNLKQGAHIHQPTAWPVPHECVQQYHQGNGSNGQLFRPYWGSSASQESKCRKFKLTVSEVRVRVSCEAGLWKETGRTEARKARKGKEKEPPLLKVKRTPQNSINELIIQKKNPLRWCQGHPTNLFLTLSVPHRNLAGWQNIRCSNELAGKFLIVRGFGWELLTFLAFQAELAEKLWRLRTTEKKYPFPPPESSDKHLTAGQRDRVCGKNRFCVGYFCEGFQSAQMSAHVQIEELSSFTCKINSHCYYRGPAEGWHRS